MLQTAIDRGIRDSIVKAGIASGEFKKETHPELFSTSASLKSAPPTTAQSIGIALAGAAVVAAGSLLMNWLSSRQTRTNAKPGAPQG
ncbi:MAG TPA: hypothetical protein VGC09_19555 [Rhodopila sp.]